VTNPYYENGGQPADATKAVAKRVRNELINIEVGFANFPVLADMLVGFTYTATTTGTANTYAAAVSAKVTSYLDHLRLSLRINATNTGASTVNVNSLGAKAIKAPDGSDLSTGDILSGKDILIEYNSSLGYFTYNGPIFTTASAAAIAAAIAAAPTNIVNDTTPELGGNLNAAGFDLLNIGGVTNDTTDKGSIATGTVTFDVSEDAKQKLTVTGALTIAFSGWPTTGNYAECEVELVNGGVATVTLPTVNWIVGDGTTSTTFADTGVTLVASGTNHLVVWSTDAGTTLYGVAG
jgi:hypothetical protein